MRFECVERRTVHSGLAEIARDHLCQEAWLVSVDGTPQSYVDLADPANLPFDAVRRIADVVDVLPPGPLSALHVGGAAASLARYVHHTRRGSEQLVVDPDGELVSLVGAHLPLPAGIELRVADGPDAVRSARGLDLIVVDAFEGASMPAEFASEEFHEDVAAALADGGAYIVKLREQPGFPAVSRLVEVITRRFGEPVVLADQGLADGLGSGTVVIVSTGVGLPVDQLDRRTRTVRLPAEVRQVC